MGPGQDREYGSTSVERGRTSALARCDGATEGSRADGRSGDEDRAGGAALGPPQTEGARESEIGGAARRPGRQRLRQRVHQSRRHARSDHRVICCVHGSLEPGGRRPARIFTSTPFSNLIIFHDSLHNSGTSRCCAKWFWFSPFEDSCRTECRTSGVRLTQTTVANQRQFHPTSARRPISAGSATRPRRRARLKDRGARLRLRWMSRCCPWRRCTRS